MSSSASPSLVSASVPKLIRMALKDPEKIDTDLLHLVANSLDAGMQMALHFTAMVPCVIRINPADGGNIDSCIYNMPSPSASTAIQVVDKLSDFSLGDAASRAAPAKEAPPPSAIEVLGTGKIEEAIVDVLADLGKSMRPRAIAPLVAARLGHEMAQGDGEAVARILTQLSKRRILRVDKNGTRTLYGLPSPTP